MALGLETKFATSTSSPTVYVGLNAGSTLDNNRGLYSPSLYGTPIGTLDDVVKNKFYSFSRYRDYY